MSDRYVTIPERVDDLEVSIVKLGDALQAAVVSLREAIEHVCNAVESFEKANRRRTEHLEAVIREIVEDNE